MTPDCTDELETLAALYALGHLQGAERAAFEAALPDPAGAGAAHLQRFQSVVAALAWGTPTAPPPGLRARLLERARQECPPPPAAGPITLAPGVLLVLADQLDWQQTPIAGLRYKPLFIDRQRRYASSLVSMAPGITYPRHRHTQPEELFLLSGDIQVGGYRLHPGDYCRAEAGTVHEAIRTETGCLFIALASVDDEYLPPAPPPPLTQATAAAPSTPPTPPLPS